MTALNRCIGLAFVVATSFASLSVQAAPESAPASGAAPVATEEPVTPAVAPPVPPQTADPAEAKPLPASAAAKPRKAPRRVHAARPGPKHVVRHHRHARRVTRRSIRRVAYVQECFLFLCRRATLIGVGFGY
jgi:hypothetical protein